MPNSIIEVHNGYRGVTIVGKNGVYYSVETRVGNEYITKWEATVLFGLDKAHRVGGYAFQQAAQKQEKMLYNAATFAMQKADYA